MKYFFQFFLPFFSFSILILSCSSGTSETNEEQTVDKSKVGVFIDSPVTGIDYSTGTFSGKTDAMGRFNYNVGENIQFSIGDIVLPETPADAIIHLTKIYNGTTSDTQVINLARLLLTLDEDQNPDNGITISEAAFSAATGLNLDFSSTSFEADVSDYLSNAGGSDILISITDAQNHIEETLEEADNFTSEEEDALLYGCKNTCVQRANYNDFVVSFYPRHEQVNVQINTKIELTIVSSADTGTGVFNVELFPVIPTADRCRIESGGFVCGENDVYDTDANWLNIINGTEFIDSGLGTNPIIFGSASIDANNKVTITPERPLASGTKYVVHVFANENFQDFKTWWVFKT